jgi:hypothetical protein
MDYTTEEKQMHPLQVGDYVSFRVCAWNGALCQVVRVKHLATFCGETLLTGWAIDIVVSGERVTVPERQLQRLSDFAHLN